MGASLKNEETVREYLLGKVSDETTLEGIEELLFTDEEFCTQVALVEDGIINDYVFGHLDEADAASFRATLAGDAEKRFKLQLTQALREKALAKNTLVEKKQEPSASFFDSLKAFFHQPKYVGALAVLLVAVLVSAIYFGSRSNTDQLAELRAMYRQERPTETRISEFAYAPLTQLRGAAESRETTRFRRIENNLIEATEKTPNAETHHALGVFYLTQQKYTDALRELESALKFSDRNAKIHNDLGATYFELAKAAPKEQKLEALAHALEEFTKATELDGTSQEALFNRSLALQELSLPRQARESWTLYLQKDASSPWAEEARRNLARLDKEQSRLRADDEQVLDDFLTAYRNRDDARAQRIHHETKGLLRGVMVSLQLSRRYLLAKQSGEEALAAESIEALTYIGNFERAQNEEFFFSELAGFYANTGADQIERLLRAKEIFASAHHSLLSDYAKAISEFENSRDLFEQLGDRAEAGIAENWAAQFLPEVGRVSESRQRLRAIIADSNERKFKVLLPPAYYWLGFSDYRQSDLSQSNRNFKTALRLALSANNVLEAHHAQEALAVNYSDLGELEPALTYESQMLPDKDLYYQSPNQSQRDKGTLADLTLKLKFFSTSLSFSKEALSLAREISPASSRVNSSLRNVVNAAAAKGDYRDALKYAGESNQIALQRSDSPENTQTTAESYLLLADIKSLTEDCDEALADYDQALELYGRLPEFTVSAYQIHKGKLFCFQQLERQEDFAAELKTVLALSEQYRATIREDDSRQAFFANEQVVFDAATDSAIKEHDSRGAFTFVEESRARSLLDFVQSGKPIAQVEKDFASVARPLSLTEIQSRIPSEVQLVQYAVLPQRLAIWVLSKTRFDLIEKPVTASELEKKIDAYRASITGKESAESVRQAGRELYDLLIPPNLEGEKQICFVADKSLHQLAFASLVSPAGKYLLEDHALFYAPSASVMVLATESARRKERVSNERLLSIGNPDFDREENLNLAGLQTAEAEARAVAEDYRDSLELHGGEATKDKFLRHFASVEVIHFAGHFVANRQSHGNSKLLFAGGDLRSSELGAYKLPEAKLVVLSACETGFERYDKSEGAIGIARTFLALGAPVVVATQWKVDSEPTKDLMIEFHRNRTEKRLTSAESLRRAQLEVLSRERTKSPFYWAAFALFGGYANY